MLEDADWRQPRISARRWRRTQGWIPCLADDNGYRDAELPMLCELCWMKRPLEKIQGLRPKEPCSGDRPRHLSGHGGAWSTTSTPCIPAPARRFPSAPSTTAPTPPPRAAWSSKTSCWPPRRAWATAKPPIFPIHIFKVKEGINYNPGRAQLRPVPAGLPGLAPSGSSPTSPSSTPRLTCSIIRQGDPEHRSAPIWAAAPGSSANVYDPTREMCLRPGQPELHLGQSAPHRHSQPTATWTSSSKSWTERLIWSSTSCWSGSKSRRKKRCATIPS